MDAMTHSEAVETMATERYLLDELTPELRDAFEEHFFECQECAMDVRAGSLFLDEARAQLPQLVADAVAPRPRRDQNLERKKPWWALWSAPGFAAPVFAVLLGVIAYQNISLIPALRSAANEARIVPMTMVHAGTRGAEPTPIKADRHKGALILIDLPMEPVYASYVFELVDAQGKRVWSQTTQRAGQTSEEGMTVPLVIPGDGLEQSAYTLSISGISPQGAQTQIERRTLEVHFDE
jgi:hypothetical protein